MIGETYMRNSICGFPFLALEQKACFMVDAGGNWGGSVSHFANPS